MKNVFFLAATAVCLTIFISSCKKDSSCPNHYTGSDCSEQITPSQVQITKITVTKFPPANSNGNDWNTTENYGYADIYPVITDSTGNTVATFSNNVLDNSYYQTAYYWTPTNPIAIPYPASPYTFTLYNHNAVLSDDNMGNAITRLYSSNNGFPASISIDNGSGLAFTISVQYVW